jgi:hypothetical protein
MTHSMLVEARGGTVAVSAEVVRTKGLIFGNRTPSPAPEGLVHGNVAPALAEEGNVDLVGVDLCVRLRRRRILGPKCLHLDRELT